MIRAVTFSGCSGFSRPLPVVPISAAKNEGIEELIDHALHVARYREVPGRVDFCPASADEHDPVGAVPSG